MANQLKQVLVLAECCDVFGSVKQTLYCQGVQSVFLDQTLWWSRDFPHGGSVHLEEVYECLLYANTFSGLVAMAAGPREDPREYLFNLFWNMVLPSCFYLTWFFRDCNICILIPCFYVNVSFSLLSYCFKFDLDAYPDCPYVLFYIFNIFFSLQKSSWNVLY